MSLKLRAKYKYRSFVHSIRSLILRFELPSWLVGAGARFALLGMIVFLGVAFVIQSSSLGTSGYQVRALENQVNELNDDIKKLSTAVAEEQSLKNIRAKLKDSTMVAATNIEYVKTGAQTAVANR